MFFGESHIHSIKKAPQSIFKMLTAAVKSGQSGTSEEIWSDERMNNKGSEMSKIVLDLVSDTFQPNGDINNGGELFVPSQG